MKASVSERDGKLKDYENRAALQESKLQTGAEELEFAMSSLESQVAKTQKAEETTAKRDERAAKLLETIRSYEGSVEFTNKQKSQVLAVRGSVDKDLSTLTKTIAKLMSRIEDLEPFEPEEEVG